jgi:phosphonate metabolism-associated iron-containing alcohol dehydrogenase
MLNHQVKIIFEEGAISKLSKEMDESFHSNLGNILVLTGVNAKIRTVSYAKLFGQLAKTKTIICHTVKPSADLKDFYNLKKQLEDQNYAVIVAYGGGSVIDMAKSLAAFSDIQSGSVEHLRTLVKDNLITNKKFVPIIAIPTTAGSGSELTQWATIWDEENKRKYSLDSQGICPKIALIDPTLTIEVPIKQTAISALDALCHATEAYWSKKSSPEIRIESLKAIHLIRHNLEDLLSNLDNQFLRTKIAEASLRAAWAVSHTKTTACHSISYPLTLHHNITHGIAVSLSLVEIMKLNEGKILNLDYLLKAFEAEAITDIENFIQKIYAMIKVSKNLAEWGISREELPSIAEQAIEPQRMKNNPVQISKLQILKTLENIF